MIYRIFVEKRVGFDVAKNKVANDIKTLLGIDAKGLRLFLRYDIEGLTDEQFEKAKGVVFSEPAVDDVFTTIDTKGKIVFATEFLPGQFDQRADSAEQCVQLLTLQNRPTVRAANVFVMDNGLSDSQVEKIKKFLINPVEMREASLGMPTTLATKLDQVQREKTVANFTNFSDSEIDEFHKANSFAMTTKDLCFVRDYFKKENRQPFFAELKVVDTYWSDHCRHTTFLTEFGSVTINSQNPHIAEAYKTYVELFEKNSKPKGKHQCLMDIATCVARSFSKQGMLKNLDVSDEINACSIKVDVCENGKSETYLLMFKNETHNHPTEIEPFGGAATCLGGAIRDPLSGRVYVYHAMRITGAGDITQPIENTLAGKLPQRVISKTAASGFSSYGNQIGLATGFVQEVYHPNYVAKRLETGFVVGQNKAENVVRSAPQPTDVVILLGGDTGRDGCGGATGSSKSHTVESVESCGAEVQKGNATEERKIQRLFRNSNVTKLIKKCNDFGAGGVSVAIGELADSLEIFLDNIPKKYEGLSGLELAISESQERMAVVIAEKDKDKFVDLCKEENLSATYVAKVTDSGRLQMFFDGQAIVDIKREFLDTNGVKLKNDIIIEEALPTYMSTVDSDIAGDIAKGDFVAALSKTLGNLNVCSQKGMVENFDSTIGAKSVLLPFGGAQQETPSIVMAAKLGGYDSDTASVASFGFSPHLTEQSPFVGSVYSVLTSVSKLIASGVRQDTIYLSLQEFFKRLKGDPVRFGCPTSAVLGAMQAQLGLKVAAIGGKDSMSGTFEDIDVPNTLISFAIGHMKHKDIITNVLCGDEKLYVVKVKRDEFFLPDFDYTNKMYSTITENILAKKIKFATVVEVGGAYSAVAKSAFGNGVGVNFEQDEQFFLNSFGDIVIATDDQSILSGLEYVALGEANKTGNITFGEMSASSSSLLKQFKSPLENVFPTTATSTGEAQNISFVGSAKASQIKTAKPKVFIPVFPGTNCEYDTARQFEMFGADVDVFVLKNKSSKDIFDSVERMKKAIDQSQIVALPGGFSGADEPDGSGKFIATVLSNPHIKDSIMNLIKNRGGLMLGICNGFQALIKLGLVPYGEILPMQKTSPTLTFNNIGRHVSQIVQTRIASNNSPWLSGTKVGDIHSVAVSHGEGRFVANQDQLQALIKNGQVATQYVDLNGNATMQSPFNPNGSVCAIEGITSPCGRVLGKMGHSERVGENLFANVKGQYQTNIFKSGVHYFK